MFPRNPQMPRALNHKLNAYSKLQTPVLAHKLMQGGQTADREAVEVFQIPTGKEREKLARVAPPSRF